jgi:hypothetical protein
MWTIDSVLGATDCGVVDSPPLVGCCEAGVPFGLLQLLLTVLEG